MAGTDDTGEQGRPQPPPEGADKQALIRAISELEAAKTRLERDARAAREDTKYALLERLLPILDNLDRALEASSARPGDPLRDGVALVREQLAGVMRDYGLEQFDPTGEPFDPRQHEAVGMTDVDRPELDRKVCAIFEPGYRAGERLLRPARVHVGRYRPWQGHGWA